MYFIYQNVIISLNILSVLFFLTMKRSMVVQKKKVNYFCDWSFVSFFSVITDIKIQFIFICWNNIFMRITNTKINLQYRLQIDTSVPLYNWTNIHVASLHQSANEFHASFAIKYALQSYTIRSCKYISILFEEHSSNDLYFPGWNTGRGLSYNKKVSSIPTKTRELSIRKCQFWNTLL